MKNILIIHLSDAHINEDNTVWTQSRAELIARSAARNGPYERIILIFSGDISNRGQKTEFDFAEIFITYITQELEKFCTCHINIVIAPGNHDCDFSSESHFRNFALTHKNEDINDEFKEKIAEPLGNFHEFSDRVERFKYDYRSVFEKSGVIDICDLKLQIRVFNTSLYSQRKEKKGDLYLPPSIFENNWKDSAIRVAVLHHPTAWLDQSVSRDIRTSLRNHATLTLYGHEHIPEISAVSSYNKSLEVGSIEVDGAVLHGHGHDSQCSFISFEIDLQTKNLHTYIHELREDDAHFITQPISSLRGEITSLRLPEKRKFITKTDFWSKISDAGIPAIKPNGQSINLSDIYVDVDLIRQTSNSNIDEVINSINLLDVSKYADGIVIQGDEKFGKTTLLYTLFDRFYSKGYFPVYICLRDHRIKKPEDIRKAFNTSLHNIYQNESEDSYYALPFEQRIFLVDDVDSLKNSELRNALISFLKSRSKYFFITSTMKMKMTEVLTDDSEGTIGNLKQLSIDRFGASKRSALISRWINATHDDLSEEDYLKKADALEKAASGILGYNMVPRVPHMLLIFLQSSDAAGKTKLESGALAHYYTFLVTEHLLKAGVEKEALEEYFSFSRLISFHMHQSKKTYISAADLERCNEIFSEVYYPGSAQTRKNILKSAKLLQDLGSDAYEWRHGYFHYLFLGGYLGENIDDGEVKSIVQEMCNHLYVRANANALLFLVHFSKDPFIFTCIENIIGTLFSGEKALRLGKDTKTFASAIKNARSIYLPEKNPEENRKNRDEIRDNHERSNGDGLSDTKREDKLSVLEELIVLFKTSEIIGQVLKEQYASIKRSTREPVVIALFETYLRACGGLITKMVGNKNIIKSWVDKTISEDGKVLTDSDAAFKAEEITSSIVQMFLFGFFQKIGDSLSSEKTLDLLRGIKWEKSIEAEMFLLSCELNIQRPIPLAKIDTLLEVADSDTAFVSLIRNFVQMRISMFHTKTSELQALASRFQLSLDQIKKVNFSEPSKR